MCAQSKPKGEREGEGKIKYKARKRQTSEGINCEIFANFFSSINFSGVFKATSDALKAPTRARATKRR